MDVLNTTSPKRVPGETASPSKTLPSSRSRRAVEVEGVFKGRLPLGRATGYHAVTISRGVEDHAPYDPGPRDRPCRLVGDIAERTAGRLHHLPQGRPHAQHQGQAPDRERPR